MDRVREKLRRLTSRLRWSLKNTPCAGEGKAGKSLGLWSPQCLPWPWGSVGASLHPTAQVPMVSVRVNHGHQGWGLPGAPCAFRLTPLQFSWKRIIWTLSILDGPGVQSLLYLSYRLGKACLTSLVAFSPHPLPHCPDDTPVSSQGHPLSREDAIPSSVLMDGLSPLKLTCSAKLSASSTRTSWAGAGLVSKKRPQATIPGCSRKGPRRLKAASLETGVVLGAFSSQRLELQ